MDVRERWERDRKFIMAIRTVRGRLLDDETLYNAFAGSIKSALDDIEGSMNHEEVSKVILDRIIGKE